MLVDQWLFVGYVLDMREYVHSCRRHAILFKDTPFVASMASSRDCSRGARSVRMECKGRRQFKDVHDVGPRTIEFVAGTDETFRALPEVA